MEYRIARRILAESRFISISKDEFEVAVQARDRLLDAIGIEEKFDILAENYAEFENELLRITSANMLFTHLSYASTRADRAMVNRRLVNLLTACRLYIDHTKHDVSSLYGNKSPQYEELCKACSREFDGRLGYAIMEELRNYVQHRGLPLYGMSYGSTRDFPGNEDLRLIQHTFVPRISLDELKQEGAFKKSVLDRLPPDDRMDMRPIVREYVSGLGAVHVELRATMQADVNSWRASLESVRQRYLEQFGEPDIGLAVIELDDQRRHRRHAHIFPDLLEEHPRLVKKNGAPQHYWRHFVSSRA